MRQFAFALFSKERVIAPAWFPSARESCYHRYLLLSIPNEIIREDETKIDLMHDMVTILAVTCIQMIYKDITQEETFGLGPLASVLAVTTCQTVAGESRQRCTVPPVSINQMWLCWRWWNDTGVKAECVRGETASSVLMMAVNVLTPAHWLKSPGLAF